MSNLKPTSSFIILIVILLVSIVSYLSMGGLLQSLLTGGLTTVEQTIFWQLRLPRLLSALSLGGGLAICGVALQTLFRNPLAEPGLIGVSGGAALGAILFLIFIPAIFITGLGIIFWSAIGSFLAGLFITSIIYYLATIHGKTDSSIMLLAGIAFNSINSALVSLLITVSDDGQLRSIIFWLMGSLSSVTWNQAIMLFFGFLLTFACLVYKSKGLDSYLLSESTCFNLGQDPQKIKNKVMILTTVFVALSVSQVGIIAFVGLVVPHIMRLLFGVNHKILLPSSAIFGAVLMVVADMMAQLLMFPLEIPIGLLMTLLGGPFFLYLLIVQRKTLQT